MVHKFDPVAMQANKDAKAALATLKQTTPSPNSIPAILTRIKAIESVLGL